MGPKSASWAQHLIEKGDQSASECEALGAALSRWPDEEVAPVFRALHDTLEPWTDSEVGKVIRAVRATVQAQPIQPSVLDSDLRRWAAAHSKRDDRAACVSDCLATKAPEEVSIRSVLSRRGHQKLVFLGDWLFPPESQGTIVVKRFLTKEAADKLLGNELLANPLSLAHPNIIATNVLRNSEQEPFLVEGRVTPVDEDWEIQDDEAANLLHDGASALSFLANYRLTHGDIKPDNLGVLDQRYLLLDFGICDREQHFASRLAEGEDPSGTMRTRPPEVLAREQPQSCQSDVWALAATVFRLVVGRYPLIETEEEADIPSPEDRPKRRKYEREIAHRARRDWDRLVTRELVRAEVGEGLRMVLARALWADSSKAIDAALLHQLCQTNLAGHVRATDGARLAPADEIEQLLRYLPRSDVLRLMPASRMGRMAETLTRLRNATSDQPGLQSKLDELDRKLADHSGGEE